MIIYKFIEENIMNIYESVAVSMVGNGLKHKDASVHTGISVQKISALLKKGNFSELNKNVKKINKQYLLTRDGMLFSLLTNKWISRQGSYYRMSVNGARIKQSYNTLISKHFKA